MQRIYLAALIASLLLLPAHADTRDDVWAAMRRCQIFQDDRTWLDCTYGAQQPMRARLGLPPAPDSQQRLVPPASSALPPAQAYVAPEPRRALSAEAPHRTASLGQIIAGTAPPIAVSALARLDYDAQGAFIVTLENGQVWRQANSQGPKVRFKIGTRVTVSPGALWSYNLKTADSSRVYKVQRGS